MPEVRIGELSGALRLPIKTLRRLADRGEIPFSRVGRGHRVFDVDAVRAALSRERLEPSVTPDVPPDWASRESLAGLQEDQVWARLSETLQFDRLSEGSRIAKYAFTEMLNNAIDHSGGNSADIDVWGSGQRIAFRISDDGEGIFAHLRAGLHLDRELDALAELTKGKRTTFKARHSGEGIFFTSKVVDEFRLSANRLRLTFDNVRRDFAAGVSPVTQGTVVEARIALPPRITLRSVFDEFSNEDLAFAKSRPVVKLFGSVVGFVSRSEARRVMEGMDAFEEVDIDFTGVDDVGQGFVDEVLRVWPAEHRNVRVVPINMNEAVNFMVQRALRSI